MTAPSICHVGSVPFGAGELALIAGPCVAESRDLCLTVAEHLADLCRDLGIAYVFKASYDKANRSSAASYRGPGLEKGLSWLAEVRQRLSVPVLSDVHDVSQVAPAADVLDCLQIPAFLCRQTDLLTEAGRLGKAVNVKKGQFMAPWDMKQAVEKVRAAGGRQVLLTDRGTCFGYNRLVTDLRAIPQMQAFAPVVFDATHSVQEPGGLGSASGGQVQYVSVLAGAAMAAGADGLFIETHPDPPRAKSDGPCMVPLTDMKALLRRCLALFRAARDQTVVPGGP
ncbi:MAG TPA: 3-deoxy-8-phosphooctulonate synthase [Phycisphaerae bacterium]|nr:3-deoxy-8-phosphooctulonate synthase [Phycisphaerae bacterium]